MGHCFLANNTEHTSCCIQLQLPLFFLLQNLMKLCNAKSTFLLQMYSNAGQNMDKFRVQLLSMPFAYPSLL